MLFLQLIVSEGSNVNSINVFFSMKSEGHCVMRLCVRHQSLQALPDILAFFPCYSEMYDVRAVCKIPCFLLRLAQQHGCCKASAPAGRHDVSSPLVLEEIRCD